MGATTIWERWDSMLPDGSINPGEKPSFNHYALGSIVNWLHESVGGISPLKPGYKEILVRPVPGASLTHAAVTYNSPYGKIEASWQLKEKDFTLQLLVPPNTKAYIVLPDRQSTSATEEDQDGVWVSSGRHEFTSQFVPNDEWPPAAITPEFWPQPPPQCA
jgi:alpha-L-rhamnosidase